MKILLSAIAILLCATSAYAEDTSKKLGEAITNTTKVKCENADAFDMKSEDQKDLWWSVRCADDREFIVEITPKDTNVASCKDMANFGVKCFTTFDDQDQDKDNNVGTPKLL